MEGDASPKRCTSFSTSCSEVHRMTAMAAWRCASRSAKCASVSPHSKILMRRGGVGASRRWFTHQSKPTTGAAPAPAASVAASDGGRSRFSASRCCAAMSSCFLAWPTAVPPLSNCKDAVRNALRNWMCASSTSQSCPSSEQFVVFPICVPSPSPPCSFCPPSPIWLLIHSSAICSELIASNAPSLPCPHLSVNGSPKVGPTKSSSSATPARQTSMWVL
mmetsp:Transcript_14773/g.31709  ORF Transcript_14773/g.31709 Transcript_14773/m.31709 type:complete len:219 (-) Transcript_14773:575-1231(-)